MNELPRWKEALFATIMALLPVFALVAFEGGARVWFWAAHGVAGKRYGIWRPDPELGAIHKENAYNSMGETNDMGFRNREAVLDPKPAGSLRVIAYGGSTTFCYQLHTDEAWPARLEQIMRSRRPGGQKDQVLNAGAVMWSIGHSYARAKRDVPLLKPDYVLIYSGVNEDWNTIMLAQEGVSMERLVAQGRFGVISKRFDQASWLKRELLVFKLFERHLQPGIHALWSAVLPSNEPPFPSDTVLCTLQNYLHVLGEMIGFLKDHGARPVFVVEITGDPTPTNVELTSYSHAGAKVAEAAGAMVVDPSPILEGNAGGPRSLFAESGVHYSEPGARKVASFLYERIFAGRREGDSVSQSPSHSEQLQSVGGSATRNPHGSASASRRVPAGGHRG